MPCLIIVGHPSAGKTTLVNLLKERALLHDSIDEVVVLNEESECGCARNDDGGQSDDYQSTLEKGAKVVTTKQKLYENSISEKQTRGALKAAFDRAVKKTGGNQNNSKRLVILDSMNYIKGFRYELHCISKAAGEKHGILWVLNRLSLVQEWNKQYSPELLNELISRFEPPDDRNRWDNPLFTIDVAATMGSTTVSTEAETGKVSSRNEVLEHSVYNMHSLGEAFGSAEEQGERRNKLNPDHSSPEANGTSKCLQKTSAKATKPPKKSAFQRRKKTTGPSRKDPTQPPSTSNSANGNFIIDTSIMDSAVSSTDDVVKENSSSNKTATIQKISQQEINNKPLDEQLDDILNTFLLKTRNLKEGMSTRQYD